MRKKEVKLPMTPITEETFIRQGWKKVEAGDGIDEARFRSRSKDHKKHKHHRDDRDRRDYRDKEDRYRKDRDRYPNRDK